MLEDVATFVWREEIVDVAEGGDDLVVDSRAGLAQQRFERVSAFLCMTDPIHAS